MFHVHAEHDCAGNTAVHAFVLRRHARTKCHDARVNGLVVVSMAMQQQPSNELSQLGRSVSGLQQAVSLFCINAHTQILICVFRRETVA